jgi:hypothetical protein
MTVGAWVEPLTVSNIDHVFRTRARRLGAVDWQIAERIGRANSIAVLVPRSVKSPASILVELGLRASQLGGKRGAAKVR